jgi:hypothetical protein
MNIKKYINYLLIFIIALLTVNCSSKNSNGMNDYNSVVEFSKGEQIKFPDFVLEYAGERSEKKDFPNGNSFTFKFYDFNISGRTDKKTISWSAGTGVIAPLSFEFAGIQFELELRNSEKLSKKLDENHLVIVKK